jgi:hypothetical protein|tara:strand:- start:409 stop:600 length:192 start_codon:yes stop_codon:yes gene_type:complete
MEISRKMLHIRFLIDEPAIKDIIDRRTLALTGFLHRFQKSSEIGAAGFAGRLNEKLGHGLSEY